MGCVLIHLQPADDAMIAQILCDASFGDAEVFRQTRTYGFAFPASTTAKKVRNGDAEGLARLNVIVGGEVGVREDEYARTRRGFVGFLQRDRRSAEKATKIHFELGETGREAGVA